MVWNDALHKECFKGHAILNSSQVIYEALWFIPRNRAGKHSGPILVNSMPFCVEVSDIHLYVSLCSMVYWPICLQLSHYNKSL